MKRRIGSWIMALVMVLSLVPATALAAELAPDDAGLIKLVEDVDISSTGYTVEGNVTLDLNGHTLTVNNGVGKIVVPVGAKLTLMDSVTNSAGAIVTNSDYSASAKSGVILVDGEFVMESGRINAVRNDPANKGQFGVVVSENGSVTINGGTIEAGWYAVSGNGNDKTTNATINVNGGTLISTADYAMYLPMAGTTNIRGGVVSGASGAVCVQRGTFNVSGGELNTSGTGNTGDWSDGTGGLGNAAVNLNAEYGAVNATITGGSFAASGDAVLLGASSAANLAISGGTFCDFSCMDYLTSNANVTVKLNKDVNDNVVIPAGTTVALDLNGNKIASSGTVIKNNGTLTIETSTDGGAITSTNHAGVGAGHNSNTTIKDITINSVEGAVITGYATGATIVIDGGVLNASDNAVVAGNGNLTDRNNNDAPREYGNTITIKGGAVLNGQITSTGYVACGIYVPWKDNITVENATINVTGGAGVVARAGSVMIVNADIRTTGNATGKVGDSRVVVPCSAVVFDSDAKYPAMAADSKISVTGGYYASEVDSVATVGETSRVVISDGYFTTDVTEYCVEGKMAVANTDTATNGTYKFVVGDVPETDVEVESDVNLGETEVVVPDTIPADVKGALEESLAGVAPDESITSAVPAAPTTAEKQDAVEKLLDKGLVTVDEDGTVAVVEPGAEITIVKEPYLDVKVAGYTETTEGTTTEKTLTLDITAKYNVKATTGTVDTDGALDDEKTVTISTGNPLTVYEPIVITVPLPADFTEENTLYVEHQKNGLTYIYTGAVESDVLTFTNPHGFSTFVISTTNTAVAQIGDIGYTNLSQAIIDSAVGGGTVKLLTDGLNATVSGDMTFKIDANGHTMDLSAAPGSTLVYVGNNTYVVYPTPTVPVYPPIVNKPTAPVVVEDAEDGKVTSSHKNASEGQTVTITVKPDAGYELGDLWVTDEYGNELVLTDKGNGRFTFVMPGGEVYVDAIFASEYAGLPFVDVEENDWFYEDVAYAYAHGLMDGVSETTFAPSATTTRAMIWTVLARMDGKNVDGGSPWYAKAQSWAMDAAVSDGTAPNGAITREQLAAMLYRFAGSPAVGASELALLDRYADAESVSDWAVEAMAWAVSTGIIDGMNGELQPQGSALRAQTAAMLARFDRYMEK